ncbi:putative ribonuclease H-like domain-containing protein [Tanacetum coccineum]
MSKVLQERGFGSLPSSTEANPRDQVKSISTTIEADSVPIRRIGPAQYAVSTGQNVHSYMLEDIKVPLILGRPFLSTARAKIDVYKRKITLRVEEERIVFTSVKPASSFIKRVYMLSLRERMELDLEARLMGETLVLTKSLDPFFEDYIKLNDLNEPFELRRNQGDDLMPTIEEGEVIKEFRTRDDELDAGIDDYPSYCDYDKKIHIDFLENMDAYRDKGIADVIFGEPFLREVGIKARRFKGMITIYNGNDEVTYETVRSHPRFKHHTNEQCNKIPPLLKDPITFETRRWKNGSHAGTLACIRWNGKEKLKKTLT